ncbi:MAG: hypothetical protein KAV87_43845, partial [Desulfobacteraceae bacterium]|nr:hypothetical protein [Desulfobacteraceae bacterium]
IKLGRDLLDRWTWKTTGRGKFKAVIAEWSELGAATIHTVTAGDSEPVLKLRHRYATEAEATRAAEGALSRSVRASGKLSVSLGGFAGNLFAEAPVDMQGIKPELTGEWTVSRVEHKLQNTLTTKFDAERDNEEAQA